MTKKAKNIKIANKFVGEGKPIFIIAEAGVNHNGKLELAKKLIIQAKKAGADAIKFQTFKAEEVTLSSCPTAPYQKQKGGINTQFELLKSLELTDKDFRLLRSLADKVGIIFLATPHGHIMSAQRLKAFKIPAFKVGSGDLTNTPFLEYLGRQKKPIILSTGMATISEIQKAIRTIKKTSNKKVVILHTTTEYPCSLLDANVSAILDLKKNFPNYLIGFSDHTQGFEADILAVGLGTSVIEKHFTLDKNLPGPDHKASLTPEEFTQMVRAIRIAEKMKGSGQKIPCKKERELATILRKSVVSIKYIRKGQKITADFLSVKRPLRGGLPPRMLAKILGKRATQDIPANKQLKKGDWQ